MVEVTAVNGVCWSNKLTLAITTVNPAPVQPGIISYSGNLCSGKSTTFSVSVVGGASTYNWVLPSGWSGSSTTNSISVTPSSADTLRISASNGSCTSPVRKQFMNIIPTPTEPSSISGVNNICVNNTSTFTIPRQSNASSYVWTYPSPGYTPIGSTTDTFLTVNVASSALNGNITAAANKSGCLSTTKTLALNVNSNIPNMPGSITGSAGVCIGSTHEFSITPVSNASSYLWSYPNGWSVVSGQNTTRIVLSPSAATGTVSVKAISGFCSSQPSNFAVNYAGDPPEAPKIIGDSTPCVNSTIGFEASYVLNGNIYEWKAPTGWTINQPSNRTTNILIGSQSGAIQVKVSNAFCSSKYTTMNVVAKTPPTPSAIAGESFVKSFTIRDYSVQNIQGTSFFWEVPSDWVLLSGNYSNKISVLTGASDGTIRVSANNECGNGTEVTKPVYSGVAAGIEETKIAQNFLCYPQPANNSFTLSFVANRDLEDGKIVLFDLLGQQINTIYTGKLSRGNTYENSIDASYLPEGVYLLQLSDRNNNKQTIKIIIHH